MYDEEDWSVRIDLKCYQVIDNNQRNEICSLHFDRTIYKYDSIVYLREGWGAKQEGHFGNKEVIIGKYISMGRRKVLSILCD